MWTILISKWGDGLKIPKKCADIIYGSIVMFCPSHLTFALFALVAAVAAVVLPVAGPREGHAAPVGAAELVVRATGGRPRCKREYFK